MPATNLSAKKLRKIARINGAVKEYFNTHPGIHEIPAMHLMPLFIRQGIYEKDTGSGLPVRILLRELSNHMQLHLLPDTSIRIEKRSYYFCRKSG